MPPDHHPLGEPTQPEGRRGKEDKYEVLIFLLMLEIIDSTEIKKEPDIRSAYTKAGITANLFNNVNDQYQFDCLKF